MKSNLMFHLLGISWLTVILMAILVVLKLFWWTFLPWYIVFLPLWGGMLAAGLFVSMLFFYFIFADNS